MDASANSATFIAYRESRELTVSNDNNKLAAAGPIGLSLSERQADLLTRLGREAGPLYMAREYAVQELNLVAIRDALDEQLGLATPFLPGETSPEYEARKRGFAKFMLRMDMKVLEDLRRGTLLAFGVRLPVRPSSVSTPIPPGLWYEISFDMDDCTASGPNLSYRDVRVIGVRSMHLTARREVDRGLAILAEQMERERATAPPSTEPTGLAPNGAREEQGVVLSLPETERPARATTPNIANAEKQGDPTVFSVRKDADEPPRDDNTPAPSYGPWSVMPQIEQELRSRAEAKPTLCKQTWREESVYLEHWARKKFKRDEATKTGDPPGLKWIREQLADLYYELNPESPRPRRRRQESKTPADIPAKH
jgi:hypothetical protein